MPRKQRFKPSRKPQSKPMGQPADKHQEVSEIHDAETQSTDVERDAPSRVEDADRSRLH